MPELWFIRHGEATHNVDAAARGETAYFDPVHMDSELTDVGYTQTVAAQRDLPRYAFDAIYCSPLRRCRQTLLNTKAMGPVFLDDRLMEPQGSHMCNRRISKDKLASVVDASWNLVGVSIVNPFDATHEEPDIFAARVRAFTDDFISRSAKSDRILIVAHHDWIRAWFCEYLGVSVSLRNAEVVRAVWPAA